MCSLTASSCNASVPDYGNCLCVKVVGCEDYNNLTKQYDTIKAVVDSLQNPTADMLQKLQNLTAQINALAQYCIDNNGHVNKTLISETISYVLAGITSFQVDVSNYISNFHPITKTTTVATTLKPTTLPPCTVNCTQSNPNFHCPANRFDNLFLFKSFWLTIWQLYSTFAPCKCGGCFCSLS